MPRRWSWHFSTGAVCYIYDGELQEKRFVLDGSNLFVSDFPFILLAFYSKLTICPLVLCLFLFQQEVNFVSATGDTVMIKTGITIKRALFFLCTLSQLRKLVFSACQRLKDYIRVRVVWEYQVKNKKSWEYRGLIETQRQWTQCAELPNWKRWRADHPFLSRSSAIQHKITATSDALTLATSVIYATQKPPSLHFN